MPVVVVVRGTCVWNQSVCRQCPLCAAAARMTGHRALATLALLATLHTAIAVITSQGPGARWDGGDQTEVRHV